MRRQAFLLVFICLLAGHFTAVAEKGKQPLALKKDSSTISVKNLDTKALKDYSKDTDFKYAEGKSESPSLWDQFWTWFWYWLGRMLVGSGATSTIFKYILLGIAVAGLLYFILKSVGMDIMGILRPRAKKTSLPYSESLENIHEIDFDTEIERAIDQHNYRLAVRLLYLKCLKQLSDANLIQWQLDKTNTTYYYELTNPAQREAFGSLTRRFEYVWYGDFAIDEHAFEHINHLFQQFKKHAA